MKLSHVVAAAVACASLVMAAEGTAPTTTTTTTTTTAPAAKKAAVAKPAAATVVHGMVSSVDVLQNTLIVKAKTTSDTFAVDTTTKITIDSKKAALGDLKPEAHVAVTYKVEGMKKMATEISEKAAAAMKPAVATEKKTETAPAPAPAAK